MKGVSVCLSASCGETYKNVNIPRFGNVPPGKKKKKRPLSLKSTPAFQVHAQDLMGHKSYFEQFRDVWEVLGNSSANTDDLAPIPDVIMCYVLIFSCLMI